MKLASNYLLETLNHSEIEDLAHQVKETLATNTCIIEKKPKVIFTAAQLWNIQRQRKTSFTRRNNAFAKF